MFKGFTLPAALFFSLALSLSAYSLADTPNNSSPSYEWGRGLTVPAANLNLGGYFDSSYDHYETQKKVIGLDDFSFFITWSPTARLRVFSEIELEDSLSNQHPAHFDSALRIERLYVDFLASQNSTLRLGKFLTPVGRWNVTHAAPLVWTTTRPFVTDDSLFPGHTNGIMLSNKYTIGEKDIDVSFYYDDSSELNPRKDLKDFDNAFGSRINIEILEHLQVGASYLGFKKISSIGQQRNHLLGLDLLWKKNNYEAQMEWIYRHAGDFQGDEKGFYVQGVAPLVSHLFAVGRYEYLNGNHQTETGAFAKGISNAAVTGLTWRPYVPLALKAEYRFGTGNQTLAPSGFFTSISVLY